MYFMLLVFLTGLRERTSAPFADQLYYKLTNLKSISKYRRVPINHSKMLSN